MVPRTSHSKTHRYLEILAFLTLLAPLVSLCFSGTMPTDPAPLVAAASSVLAGAALWYRPLRRASWLAILASGLTDMVFRPHLADGMLLVLLGTFLIFDSGWVRRGRVLRTLAIGALIVAAQALSVVLHPNSLLSDLAYWVIVDVLLGVLSVTFRSELFGRPQDGRPLLDMDTFGLTARETQIIHLVWGGETPKEIAGFLGMSDGSVRMNLSRVYAKLGVPGLRELSHLVHTHRVAWKPEGSRPAARPGD